MARNITVIPAKSRNELKGKNRAEKKLKVAAYCRVSTDQEDQLHSFEAQVEYYTRYISDHPNYEMAGIPCGICWGMMAYMTLSVYR